MSWEKICTNSEPCPCGKGTIYQNEYGDDWNRFEDGPVVINCEQCRKKYKIESVHYHRLLTSDGSWCINFLVPIDYPDYHGITVSKKFPQKTGLFQNTFDEYLMKNFSYLNIQDAYNEMLKLGAFSKLSGYGKQICKDYKRRYDTVRIKTILPYVEEAMQKYKYCKDNFEMREIVHKEEEKERKIYDEEKRKHSIKLSF